MDEKNYYSCDELIALYQAVGKPDADALNAEAERRYQRPNAPKIQVEAGLHGRSFPSLEDPEVYLVPQYTLKGGHCCWVGVMEDGRLLEY